MRPADLWRHSTFRLALGVALFILTVLILASGVGYGLMQRQLAARQDARVTEIFKAIDETSLKGDRIDLVEAVDARIKASPDRSTVFLLRDASGAVLATNIADVTLPDGWSTVPAARLAVPTDYPYRVFVGRAGAYSLAVGLTNADLDDLQEIVLGAFEWAALFALLAAIAVGVLLAMRMQDRLSRAEAAAERVAQGDLSARLPISDRGDDLDRISCAVNLSLSRLEGSVEAMRQVSADIAHDLRTPLNRLKIRIEAATARLAEGLSADHDLTSAGVESDRIIETFSALLRIAQIESGARRESFKPLDLGTLLRDVVEVYADVAEDAGQRLILEAADVAIVDGDKELLTQGFANLIENAIRHCPAGTRITCGIGTAGARIEARVCDTGPGIPPEEREKVLRRLYRLEKSRTTEGNGLGLALVKAVAELHDADLALSDADPGLRVTMRFPRSKRA